MRKFNAPITVKKGMLFLLSTSIFLLIACKDDEFKDDEFKEEGQFQFSFSSDNIESSRVAEDVTLEKVIYSITSEDGSMIAENEEASLHFVDSSYVTEPTSYLIGNYSVTEFIVVSSEGLVHYATPKEGSDLAYLVEDPLSIDFAVGIDDVTQVVPEVVSTEERSVEDFGYEEFAFDIVETFDVLLGVFVYDEDKSGFELTDAEITVYADGDSLTSQALFAATSKLTFPDRFEEFKLIVSKEGYTSFDYTYSADSIKNYQGDNANG
ncbi:MAG: hypothetical protein AAGC64_13890, partial [Bacteroidota bacterium]